VSLGYICLTRSDDNEENNIFYGLITCVLVLGVPISIMLFPNGPFTRPHPILWRIVFGGLLCYMLALVFMLFCSMSQSTDFTVIRVLKFELSSPRNDLY
jgi:phosphatidylserine synthase 1